MSSAAWNPLIREEELISSGTTRLSHLKIQAPLSQQPTPISHCARETSEVPQLAPHGGLKSASDPEGAFPSVKAAPSGSSSVAANIFCKNILLWGQKAIFSFIRKAGYMIQVGFLFVCEAAGFHMENDKRKSIQVHCPSWSHLFALMGPNECKMQNGGCFAVAGRIEFGIGGGFWSWPVTPVIS